MDAASWPPRFWKIHFQLDDGAEIAFCDSRRFARVRFGDCGLKEGFGAWGGLAHMMKVWQSWGALSGRGRRAKQWRYPSQRAMSSCVPSADLIQSPARHAPGAPPIHRQHANVPVHPFLNLRQVQYVADPLALPSIAALGWDPLTGMPGVGELTQALARQRRSMKAVLLDQVGEAEREEWGLGEEAPRAAGLEAGAQEAAGRPRGCVRAGEWARARLADTLPPLPASHPCTVFLGWSRELGGRRGAVPGAHPPGAARQCVD